MRASSLVHQQPPTPPTVDQELQYNLHHLSRNNSDHGYVTSQPSSVYGSPMLQNSHYSPVQFHSQIGSPVADFGVQFDNFRDQMSNPYPALGSSLRPLPQYPHLPSRMSPPTPKSTHGSEYGFAVRSRLDHSGVHRSVSRTASPQVDDHVYQPKTQRARKARGAKADLPKSLQLTAPLSVLTSQYNDVPVKDMEAWVNRPIEDRKREAERRNGYIARPMNCFMLYRSAYQERTKVWCQENNHQVVSAVTGASWPMESPLIQERYKDLAKLERLNHQKAFPNYKFSPSKAGAAPRKRKRDASEGGDGDFEENAGQNEVAGIFGTPVYDDAVQRLKREAADPAYASADCFDSEPMYFPSPVGGNMWQEAGARMHPNATGTASYEHMYGSPTEGTTTLSRLEEPQLSQMEHNSAYFAPMQTLLGLAEQQNGLFQVNSRTGTPIPDEGHVDPTLVSHSPVHFKQEDKFANDPVLTENGLYHVDSPFQSSEPDYKPHRWEDHNPSVAALEHESEFNKWYN